MPVIPAFGTLSSYSAFVFVCAPAGRPDETKLGTQCVHEPDGDVQAAIARRLDTTTHSFHMVYRCVDGPEVGEDHSGAGETVPRITGLGVCASPSVELGMPDNHEIRTWPSSYIYDHLPSKYAQISSSAWLPSRINSQPWTSLGEVTVGNEAVGMYMGYGIPDVGREYGQSCSLSDDEQ